MAMRIVVGFRDNGSTLTNASTECLLNLYSGNLASRNIVPFVKKEHVVLDSEYLETLVVAVPK